MFNWIPVESILWTCERMFHKSYRECILCPRSSKPRWSTVSVLIITVYMESLVPETGASICFQHWADFFLYRLEKVDLSTLGGLFKYHNQTRSQDFTTWGGYIIRKISIQVHTAKGSVGALQRFWCILDRYGSIWCYIKTIYAKIICDYSQSCNIIHYNCYFSTLKKNSLTLWGTCTHHLVSCSEMASDKFQLVLL